MPMLDVSFMTYDPYLSDTLAVQRRLNSTGTTGRVSGALGQLCTGVPGVVTQEDPKDLIRTEDGMSVPRRIFVASTFQFFAENPTNQPDWITWNGITYTVESVVPYSRFGAGTYEAVAEYRGPVPAVQ